MKKPQTTRQQYSACGACRTRRIKCDLKDLCQDAIEAGVSPVCTTCRERDLVCTYEFSNMQANKLFRRGRRIKEVEAVYGKPSASSSSSSRLQEAKNQPAFSFMLSPKQDIRTYSPENAASIPKLNPQFFNSEFFKRFQLQRPIIDPQEFSSRYIEHYTSANTTAGTTSRNMLDQAGHLISMLLVIWAASYGYDESGNEKPKPSFHHRRTGSNGDGGGVGVIDDRRVNVNTMVKDVLTLVDVYGILRTTTWDGVRALLLLQPLTVDVLTPLDRLVMHESTISQVNTLCSLSSVDFGLGLYNNSLVRSRIFWYAHTHEGINTGLKGGRMILSDDDLDLFQGTVPELDTNIAYTNPSFPYHFAFQLSMVPLRISTACRQIYTCLTGLRSSRRTGGRHRSVDEAALKEAGEMLENSWFDLDNFKKNNDGVVFTGEECDFFVGLWQIVIFECCNTLREKFNERTSSPVVSPSSSTQSLNRSPQFGLSGILLSKCTHMLPLVLSIIRRHLHLPLIEFDSNLIKGGIVQAAKLIIEIQGTDYDFKLCTDALSKMRWVYSDRDQKIKSLYAEQQQRMQLLNDQTILSPFSPTGSTSSSAGNIANSASLYSPVNLSPSSTFNNALPFASTSRAGSTSSSSSNSVEDQSDWLNDASAYIVPNRPARYYDSATTTDIQQRGAYSLNDDMQLAGTANTTLSYTPTPTHNISPTHGYPLYTTLPVPRISPQPAMYVSTNTTNRISPPSSSAMLDTNPQAQQSHWMRNDTYGQYTIPPQYNNPSY